MEHMLPELSGLHAEKRGLGGKTVTFQIVGGGGAVVYNEPMAYNKLGGSVDMFSKEIFEILTI